MDSKNTTMGSKTQFIREILRQLCHPVGGIEKNIKKLDRKINNIPDSIKLSPKCFNDWNELLILINGWVNIGITENTILCFKELGFGEIIPDIYPNLDIYSSGYAPNAIHNFLETGNIDKSYRCVINYISFIKLIQFMKHNKIVDPTQMDKSLNTIFKNINYNNFWLNIIISKKVAFFLKKNNIGEVILKDGTGEGPRTSESDNISHLSGCDDESSSGESSSDDDNMDILNKLPINKIFYRLVMNNNTLLSFLKYSCNNQNINFDENIFETVNGSKEDFSEMFGKLQI